MSPNEYQVVGFLVGVFIFLFIRSLINLRTTDLIKKHVDKFVIAKDLVKKDPCEPLDHDYRKTYVQITGFAHNGNQEVCLTCGLFRGLDYSATSYFLEILSEKLDAYQAKLAKELRESAELERIFHGMLMSYANKELAHMNTKEEVIEFCKKVPSIANEATEKLKAEMEALGDAFYQ